MYAQIHTIEPFDTNIGGKIEFSWNGNQIYRIRCIIKNNDTGVTVYDRSVDSMNKIYQIPAASGLVNGTYYIAYITVFDVNNTESSLQAIGTPFYCFSTPTFQLSVSEGDIVRASSYAISLFYQQREHEELDEFTINLYSYQKTLLQSSGKIYSLDENNYIISALENANQYYLEAIGKTKNGIYLSTGQILFTVAYKQAHVFSTLELNNKADVGAIEIRSNIISTEGVPDHEVIYIDNKYADLRDNRVTFDIGYLAVGDFSKIFVFYEPNLNANIVTFSNSSKSMVVDILYREGSYTDSFGTQGYFELQAKYSYSTYVRFSNFINKPSSNQMFSLCVNRFGNFYDLQVCLVDK